MNIPLLETIKQILKYAKFLKELCTHKRRLRGNEKVSEGRNVSAPIQPPMPPKCKDPGTFTIPCTIGNMEFTFAMLDLRTSINEIPKSVYSTLQIDTLSPIRVVVQLANRSTIYQIRVLEDILVKVKDLIFFADFYVLDMENDITFGHEPLILVRLFFKTAKTIITMHKRTLSMEFAGNKIDFNILDAMRHPMDDHSTMHVVNLIDLLVEDASADFQNQMVSDFQEISDFVDVFHCECTGFDLCQACVEIERTLCPVDFDLDSDIVSIFNSDSVPIFNFVSLLDSS